jgi:ABC-type Fe3+/spermidine/putrescine transport system ATPase subunit
MLTLKSITRSFGSGLQVLHGIDLDVAEGEIICLLGPSGCGKTTLLRTIAGLENPDSGDMLLNGESILNLPVHQRGFGLMFQDYALFPHMDVAANIAFGLKVLGWSAGEQQERVLEMLELVNLAGYEHRDVAQLSGGERQRVALARSLAPRPRILMLDEPLGALDAALREQLIVELRTIIRQLGLTTIYVTHDHYEAFVIADRVGVMNSGRIEQIGTPFDVYHRPNSVVVARFLGMDNLVPILGQTDAVVQTAVGCFSVSTPARYLLLHPDGVQLAESLSGSDIVGTVQECIFLGDSYRVRLEHSSGQHITFKLATSATESLDVGKLIGIRIRPEMIIPLTR